MDNFSIGALKARNIAEQFGVVEGFSETLVEKAHKVGDMHANGKWIWTEYKPGRFDWRPLKGRSGVDRTPKGGNVPAKKEDDGGKKTATAQASPSEDKSKIPGVAGIIDGFKIQRSEYSDLSKMSLEKTPKGNWRLYYNGKDTGTTMQASVISEANAKKAGLLKDEGGEKKKAPTIDDHAKKTPTKTLENAAKSKKAPGSIKGAAEAELKSRKDEDIAKKLNLRSKDDNLATTLTRIASEWDGYDDKQKTATRQAISAARDGVLKSILAGESGDEAMNALADLTSLQNFMKQNNNTAQPKQIGEVINDLMSDLKAKTSADTAAGKEKVKKYADKASALDTGEEIKLYGEGGEDISIKCVDTFSDGTKAYTLRVGGADVYKTSSAEIISQKTFSLYPNATSGSSKAAPVPKSTVIGAKTFEKSSTDLETISEVEDYAKSIPNTTFKNVKTVFSKEPNAKAFELTYSKGGKMVVDFINDEEFVYKLIDNTGKVIIDTNSTSENSRTDWSKQLNPSSVISERIKVMKQELIKLKGDKRKASLRYYDNMTDFAYQYTFEQAVKAVDAQEEKIKRWEEYISKF